MNLNTHPQYVKPMKENITLNQDPAIIMWLLSPVTSSKSRKGLGRRGASDGIYGPLNNWEEKSPSKKRNETL